jgi:hypothetical protein
MGCAELPDQDSQESIEKSHGHSLPDNNDRVVEEYEVDAHAISPDDIDDIVEPILTKCNYGMQSKALLGPSDISTNPSQGPVRPILQSYPNTMFGFRVRSFVATWFEGNAWIEYSKMKDKVICFACRHFSSHRSTAGKDNETTFSVTGFSN